MTDVRVTAFNELKDRVLRADYLIHPDLTVNNKGNLSREFHVFCDASMNGIGGVIGQVQ